VGTPRGQQQDIPNRQRGGHALWRNDEEEVESEFDELGWVGLGMIWET
jgi:hypothetical protein